nr:MAG TPA: hypothetical protein [Caudoviricetes sp.]
MMMMAIKSQKCAFFRADPPRGQADPTRRTHKKVENIRSVLTYFSN